MNQAPLKPTSADETQAKKIADLHASAVISVAAGDCDTLRIRIFTITMGACVGGLVGGLVSEGAQDSEPKIVQRLLESRYLA